MQPEEVNPQPIPGQRRDEDEEEEEFADALETLSRTESYFLNCSEPSEASRTFSTSDASAKGFMMDRFLPAAKAMATGSPRSSRKPPTRAKEGVDRPRSRVPLSYPYGPYGVRYDEAVEEEEENDDDCYESNDGHFLGKGCGLIPNFCFKSSSLCLLNPVPGMKAPNRRLVSKRMGGRPMKAMPDGYLGQAEEEYSWEQVYKHNLTQTYSPKEEDRSKVTSESDHLTYGSDSQTADGSSSPYRRSNCGGISPYRNEPSQSPFYEGKGFLGVPPREKKNSTHDGLESFEKHRDDYWVITPTRASLQGSGSVSPAVDMTLHVGCKHMMLETPHSKSSSIDTSSETKGTVQSADEDSEVGIESRRMGESLFVENSCKNALPTNLNAVCAVTDENNGLKRHDSAQSLKEEDQVNNNVDLLQSLLPPPLPNSPSESWLSRALPSVSSKNPSTQSFLGMQFHPKKQAINASSTDVRLIISAKPPRTQHGPTRFADMLENPQSPQSEI